MLFHWVRGDDAASLVRQGVISVPEAASLVIQATQDLAAKGFRVLDMKPNHIILRHRPGTRPLAPPWSAGLCGGGF